MAEIYHRYIFLQGGSFFDTGGSPNIEGVGCLEMQSKFGAMGINEEGRGY
jgi:hypothetical protein